jgi:hypothetical protein
MQRINVVWMHDSRLVGWTGAVEWLQYMAILCGHSGRAIIRYVYVYVREE